MRKEDIQVEKTYTNGKGKLRKVFDFNDNYNGFTTSITPTEDQSARFDVLYTHEHEGQWKGRTGRMWLPNFAEWAKEVVNDD